MSATICPGCGGVKLICGLMVGHQGSGAAFAPLSTRIHFGELGVCPSAVFHTCLDCGLLWSSVDPQAIRHYIRLTGRELAKQELDEIDLGPCRDLPDTTWGRMVGGYITELDALARAGGTSLLRRYRDMRGVTWDVASSEASSWKHLTREEKLALFGWVPKSKPPKDDLGELL